MRSDEATLRAYLDNELSTTERQLFETRLANSPRLQTRLNNLRRQMTKTQQVLQKLAPTGETQSSAGLAFKKIQSRLNLLSPPPSSDRANDAAGQTVWEAPSLGMQLKRGLKFPSFHSYSSGEKITMRNATAFISTVIVMALIVVAIVVLNPTTDADPSFSAKVVQLPAEATPVAATLNNEIELVGYHLSQETAQPGDTLTLTLYWQALRPPEENYTVFVHVATVDGAILISQIDRMPMRGQALTSEWQPGQLVEDVYDVDIIANFPPGVYTLLTGMYNPTTRARLPVYEAEGTLSSTDNISLAQLTVENDTLVMELPPVDLSRLTYGIWVDPQGNVATNIGHIKTLGLEWVLVSMPWKEVEPEPSVYEWVEWDSLIQGYAASGSRVMLTVAHAPDWARPADDNKSVEGLPADPTTYAGFLAQVAERYQGQVQAIEIWNEQNLWYKVGGQDRIDAAQYVKLLRQTYPAIKTANPEMLVVSGGLSPAGDVGGAAVDDIDYLKQMYAAGAKDYFDLLGARPGGFNCPALADWRTVEDDTAIFEGPFRNRHHSWCFLGTMEGYREVMLTNGDEAKKVAITRFGWAVGTEKRPGYEYALDNTSTEQAQWIIEAYEWVADQGWVGPMILFNLDLTFADEFEIFSILDTPAYEAVMKLERE